MNQQHSISKPLDVRFSRPNMATKMFSFLAAGLLIWIIILVKSSNYENLGYSSLILGYTIFVTSFQLSRLLSATFYRPSYNKVVNGYGQHNGSKKNGKNGYLYEPYVTFVIPCKNEEGAIANTVTQCFRADYPKNKIEVIVINDGSTDRTGEILNSLKNTIFPDLIVVHWKKNKGKRAGMLEGFRRAKGEIVVQLDSDSYIEPSGFRNVVKPFVNPKIGGVSFHTDPQNADENILTKMQCAYYFMSFRILKAAESSYGVVFCLSGCASAYRKDVVLPILDEWVKEKFLGLPVTWGDDRALTNWVLKLGYHTIYSDESKAFTVVPNNFKGFLKQQIRWKKGWFVNSIFASKFILKKEPFVALTYFFPLILVTLITPFIALRSLVYMPLMHNPFMLLPYLLGVLLVAALIVVYYHYLSPENKYWKYLFVWAIINMVFLSFLLYYALPTIQNRKWGTR